MPGRYVNKAGETMVNRGLYLTETLMRRVEAIAHAEERTISDVLRRALKAGLDVLERRPKRRRASTGPGREG
jgi:predicted transcriptional regulator